MDFNLILNYKRDFTTIFRFSMLWRLKCLRFRTILNLRNILDEICFLRLSNSFLMLSFYIFHPSLPFSYFSINFFFFINHLELLIFTHFYFMRFFNRPKYLSFLFILLHFSIDKLNIYLLSFITSLSYLGLLSLNHFFVKITTLF